MSDLLCCLWMYSEFEVAACVIVEVRFVCIDRFPTDRMRHLDDEEWINGGLPSLPCPKVWINAVTSRRVLYVNRAMSTCVTDDAIFRMY